MLSHRCRSHLQIYSLVFAVVGLSLASGACAPEQSAEKRERERQERAIERLARAEGAYAGTVLTAARRAVPFALIVNVNRNPEQSGDAPALSARMRFGLFGGVDLTADVVSFDYGNGRLTAAFGAGGGGGAEAGAKSAAAGAKSIELQAEVTGAGLTNARLLGPSGTTYEVAAAMAPGLTLEEPSVEHTHGIRIEQPTNSEPVDAVLSLTRRTGDIAAPASSDMPRMPQIEGALRFPGAARVAHGASLIHYDALADALDVYFPGGNGMRLAFTEVSAVADGKSLTFGSVPNLKGTAELGSRTVGTVGFSPNQLQLIDRTRNTQLPAVNYLGYYQNSVGRRLPVVANTVYLGTEGSSGAATPFDRFPKVRLEISICLGSQAFTTKKLVLTALDYFTTEATFAVENQSTERIYVTYRDSWSKLETKIIDDSDGGAGTNSSTMHLLAAGETGRMLTCADANNGGAPAALRSLLRLDREDNDPFEDTNDPIEDPYLTYEGYLTRGGAAAVPVGIAIFPRQNPGDGSDEPSLQVTARIGFFGGANLASEPAVFNWGSGQISASFKRPSGAPLELRGILEPETLRDAVLIGPNLGQSKLVVQRGTEPYASVGQEAVFNTAVARGEAPVDPNNALLGLLTLRSRAEGSTAPANIDLPVLPSIDASLRIDGLGQTPQVGTKVIYDVLRGTIEVYFSDSAVLEFSSVFLQPTNSPTRPYQAFTDLNGRMILGGAPVSAVSAKDVTSGGRWTVQDLPYTVYIGTYRGGGSNQRLKALARVDYPGNAGRNTAEYPFAVFPNLHMTVTLCLGNSAFSRRDLELESVDYLGRQLMFKNRGTGVRNALEIEFEPRWLNLKGEFRDTDGSSGDTQGSKLNLTALPNASNIDCSTPLPTR